MLVGSATQGKTGGRASSQPVAAEGGTRYVDCAYACLNIRRCVTSWFHMCRKSRSGGDRDVEAASTRGAGSGRVKRVAQKVLAMSISYVGVSRIKLERVGLRWSESD